MDKVSIIIPDRNGMPYLQQTVDDLLVKAEGDIEVIVVMDGMWADPPLKNDPRVRIIHHGTQFNNPGMRESINQGVAISTGKYIMKIDEQCIVDQGFDTKLKTDCDDNWVVIPRRYRLNWDTFQVDSEDKRPPIDYMHIDYPYLKPFDKTQGLHGAEWKQRYYDRLDILIDETPTMQGSCYFMTRKYWDQLLPNGLDTDNYGTFTQEAQEISMAAWLSGGSVMVNKKTFYVHGHKGKKGKSYGFSNEQYKRHCEGNERGRIFCINHWLYTKAYLHDFSWFVNEKFPDMPGWEPDWREKIEQDRGKDYSTLKYKEDYWLSNLRK